MLVWGSGWFRSPKHAPKLIRNVGHNFKRPMAESLALHCCASEVIFRNGPVHYGRGTGHNHRAASTLQSASSEKKPLSMGPLPSRVLNRNQRAQSFAIGFVLYLTNKASDRFRNPGSDIAKATRDDATGATILL